MSTPPFARPQPHQPRQQRHEEGQERAQQPIRIVIPLKEREPIGLELDFSAEAKTGTGVRVSRVDAGLAERMGLRQEDRLAYIGDEDIRGVDYDDIREMLQNLSYPTELVFERKARRSVGGYFSASPGRKAPTSATGSRRQQFSHSLLRGHATADAEPAANRPVTRKRSREEQNRSPSPTDAPCRPAPPLQRDLEEQLEFLPDQQSRSPSPTDAPARPAPPMHGDLGGQLDLLAARQSRSPSSADAPPARPAPSMHGDLVQQLDFLAARQLAEEKESAAAAAPRVVPAGRKVSPALRKTPAGDRSTSSAADHLAAVAGARSSASLATPGLTAVALAMASKSKKAEALLRGQRHDRPHEHRPRDPCQNRRRQHPQRGQEEKEEEEGERERELVVMSAPLPPSPPPLLPPPKQRPRSHSGVSPSGGQRRDAHIRVGSPRGEGGGGGEGVCRESAVLMASPAMKPPLWIETLVSVSLADMAGTDAARAAVVGKEVRDILAKELTVLQRLRKIPARVTLAQYMSLRGASLASSASYRTLKSLEELYLVEHEDELAEIAEESLIGGLVGSPSAKARSPPPRADDGGGGGGGSGIDDLPRLKIAPPYASIETVEAMPRWVRFIRDSHRSTQDIVRRALASHERAVATTGVHRLLRKQGLLDVEETRAAGKKTERQATEVLAKIRDWKKTARVGEHFAVEVSGAVIGRAELMRDALELLMAGIEKQRSRLETLATFRLLEEPATEGWRDLSA